MNKKDFRLLVENWRRFIAENEEKLADMTLLEEFEKWSEYDVFKNDDNEKKRGNCSFYAWEFGRFCKKKGKNPKIVFMWNDINLPWKKDGDPVSEDHVVACVDGKIYDFVRGLYSGEQKKLTSEDRKDPDCMVFNKSLFEDSGYYGGKGYRCYYVEDNPGFDDEGKEEDVNAIRFTSYEKDKVKNGPAPWAPQVGIYKPPEKKI